MAGGKEFEADRDMYNDAEWKERVEKWKFRQEKRGLVSKDDGGNDKGEEEDEYMQVLSLSSFQRH